MCAEARNARDPEKVNALPADEEPDEKYQRERQTQKQGKQGPAKVADRTKCIAHPDNLILHRDKQAQGLSPVP
jgi:hypothetical protein